MILHHYQKTCLDDLMRFFAETKETKSPETAFLSLCKRPYYPAPNVGDDTPYVCVRIPTGGGKTLMAAHALCRIAKEYLDTDPPLCLWLAPSDKIVKQTLKNLQDRQHPCRLALAESFGGNVNCISITEALRIAKSDLDGAATVIVCTVQSLRVEKTEGRKVYDPNGHLMSHFDKLRKTINTKGDCIVESLANVIKLRRPIIISDEAHNAATKLSYETLARFSPSCVVEWTATPQTKRIAKEEKYPSNVISQASARELKNAGMIKFPIIMKTSNDWRQSIREAINRRRILEKEAKKLRKNNEEYIRPIVLYQAENKSGEATIEKIKNMLIKDCEIPEKEIAVHTGTARELEKQGNINLMSSDCDIRHIITVKALAEGWDCSFAYVLCTMANMKSPKAVEQVLGRVLRLPGASHKNNEALNKCYAFAKGDVVEVAYALKDALIKKSGFQTMEANDFVSSPATETLPLFRGQSPVPLKSDKTPKLSVPMLMVRESGKLDFLDTAHFLSVKWSIAKKKPDMSSFDKLGAKVGEFIIDVADRTGKIKSTDIKEYIVQNPALIAADKKFSLESLVAWLDTNIEHLDISQTHSSPFFYAALRELQKKYKIEQLAARRYDIKKHLVRQIKKLRQEEAQKGFQQMLKMKGMQVEEGKLEVSAAHAIEFSRQHYEARDTCDISDIFHKHIFRGEVGELKSEGEEFECARFLDEMEEVKDWVRNLDRRDYSFSLPTTTDRFYPDFICRLEDGRILVVEYKNEDRWSNDDSKEKRAIGEVWARVGGKNCLFVMPKGKDWQAIRDCIAGKKAA